VQDNVAPPEKPHSIEVVASGWNVDKWAAPASFVRIRTTEPLWITLFLPTTNDGRTTKKVALFDGKEQRIVEVARRKVAKVGPFLPDGGEIDLHVICEYSETGGLNDRRKLGVVLQLEDGEGAKPPVDLKAFEKTFVAPMNHPDAVLVALEFDHAFYLQQFKPEDRPDNPLMHYLLLGWRTGFDPNPDFSVAEFALDGPLAELPESNPLALDIMARKSFVGLGGGEGLQDDPVDDRLHALWSELAGPIAERRPDFRVDADLYHKLHRDVAESNISAEEHFKVHGLPEGRAGNLYGLLGSQISGLKQKLLDLLHHEELIALVEGDQSGAIELVFELLALGSPVDQTISDFSAKFYLETYKDIRDAGTLPIVHYLSYGIREGRQTLATLRARMFPGQQVFDPALPTCLICSHDFSKTGAPMVALDLAKEASLTHNVIVASLRPGELRLAFAPYCMVMLTSGTPFEEFGYFNHPALDKIDFAILNSVECWAFTKLLVSRSIPFASYIHEYTDYTRPTYKTKFMCWFSDIIVYSSDAVRDSWKLAFREARFDATRESAVIPQHQLVDGGIPETEYLEARARLSDLLGIDCTDRRIIYGAGQIQIRKGTDLFVMTAQQAAAIDPEAVFVWIGDGQNHEDLIFGVWLDKHLRESGANTPGSNLFFLPAGPYYLDLCKAADAMFMSSRIDPLPNVVFDATRNGAAVVLFEGSSGFDDAIYSKSHLLHHVNFGRLDSACSALLDMPRKAADASGLMSAARGQIAVPEADAEAPKLAPFHEIRGRLEARLAETYDTRSQADLYDVPMMYSNEDSHAEFRKLERAKTRRYGRQMIWNAPKEAMAAASAIGGWTHEGTKILKYKDFRKNADVPKFSIHNHAFYLDGLENEIISYAFYHRADRIVFTTDSQNKARRIRNIGRKNNLDIETVVVPNKGRDILPFINLVAGDSEEADDHIWCHIHRKKSIQSATTGDVWWSFLMSVLAGGNLTLSSALEEISKKNVGLVTAFDPYIVGWDDAARLLPRFERRFPHPLPEHPVLFPVGNMFWIKTGVVRQMQKIFGETYPWPNEPIANDGTEYHLMERLWPAATKMSGLSSRFLDKKGQQRA
jgi:glycosyltransferase involved in cell wall biosynthesis